MTSSFTDRAVQEDPDNCGCQRHNLFLSPVDSLVGIENQPLSDLLIAMCGGEERTGDMVV